MSWKTYTIKEKTDLTVSAYVKGRFKLSSRDIQGLFRKKRVKVNSRVAHSKRPLKVGDVLTVQLPQDKDYGMTVEKGAIRIAFDYAIDGLKSSDGQPLNDFEIAGSDKKFHHATATIDGETVVVSSPNVKKPLAVRFAWTNISVPNLASGKGLPASTFRTDDWKLQ